MRVAEEDGGLDGGKGRAGQCGASATAKGIVHYLAALAVADEDNLGVGALPVEVGHGLDDSRGSLGSLLREGNLLVSFWHVCNCKGAKGGMSTGNVQSCHS